MMVATMAVATIDVTAVVLVTLNTSRFGPENQNTAEARTTDPMPDGY